MNSMQYIKYDFKSFTLQGINLMFINESFMKPTYKNITRDELNNYIRLTFLLVQP